MSAFQNVREIMRRLTSRRRSFVEVCTFFVIVAAFVCQAISVRAQRGAQNGYETAMSLVVPSALKEVWATAEQTQEHPGSAESKRSRFAVVSIRKNNSGGPQHIGVATADGYQMKNLFLGI